MSWLAVILILLLFLILHCTVKVSNSQSVVKNKVKVFSCQSSRLKSTFSQIRAFRDPLPVCFPRLTVFGALCIVPFVVPTIVPYPQATKEQAKALYLDGFTPGAISVKLSNGRRLPRETIQKWAVRGRWASIRHALASNTLTRCNGGDILERGESARLRGKLAAMLQDQAEMLDGVRARNGKPDLNHLAKSTAVIESIARSAKIVHDWGQGGSSGIILIEELRKVEAPRLPDEPACMLPATTDSSSVEVASLTMPQEAQPVTPQLDEGATK